MSQTEPTPDAAAAPLTDIFRRALRDMLVLVGVLAVLGLGLGAVVGGLPGVWGAAIGVGIALVFSGSTVLVMLKTAGSSLTVAGGVLVATWLAKTLLLIIVIALLRDQDFYHRGALGVVAIVGVLGSALLDYRAASRGRVPYVQPER